MTDWFALAVDICRPVRVEVSGGLDRQARNPVGLPAARLGDEPVRVAQPPQAGCDGPETKPCLECDGAGWFEHPRLLSKMLRCGECDGSGEVWK